MIASQKLVTEFESLKVDLIAKHKELGMKASGNWIDSLDVEVKGLTATIYGEHYTEQLVEGRASGKFPPIAAITQWIKDKGITPFDNISISSLAFLIARKIAKSGTKYYQEGGTELVSAVITPQRIQQIIDSVSEFSINNFYSQITKVLEDIKIAA